MDLTKFCTKPATTVTKDSNIEEAAKLMREFHVGNLVVVDGKGINAKPIGILTDRDIVMSTVALGIDPADMDVGEIMSTNLYTIKSNESIYRVIGLMKEYGVRRVPVVNEEGGLVGVLSVADLLALLSNELQEIANLPKKQKQIEETRRRHIA